MEQKGTKKEAMDFAAIELFACKGIAGTTIKDISKKAEVTEGALYRHYPSKDEMAAALFDRELLHISERLLNAFNETASVAENLRSIIHTLYAAYKMQPYSLLFVFLNFQSVQGNASLDEKAHIYDFIINYTQQLLSSTRQQQETELLATLITGVIIQPIFFHHYNKLPQHPLFYVDEITKKCCQMMEIPYE